jgi:Tol biopolymer transport system component
MNYRIFKNTTFIIVSLVLLHFPVSCLAMSDIWKGGFEGEVVLSYGRDNLIILDLSTLHQEKIGLSYDDKIIYFPSYPSLSSDGKQILLAHYIDNKGVISVINRNANTLSTVVDSNLDCDYPSWSHDNKRVAFLGRPLTDNAEYQLYIYSFEKNDIDIVYESSVGAFRPTWSPDDSKIAFSTIDNRIFIFDLVKRKIDLLVKFGVSPCWSNDGKYLVYRGQKNVYLYDFENRENKIIIRNWGWTDIKDFSWSPEGAYFLFQTLTDRKSPLELFSITEEERTKLVEFGNLRGFNWGH